MRPWISWLLIAVALGGCGEGAPAAPQPEGTVYGAGVGDAPPVAISRLCDRIDEFEGRRVQVEGLITDVCPKRGCWIKLASDREYEDVTFKVTDGVIVFPLSAKGKYAVAEGVARKVELSLERTRDYLAHLAEEKEEAFDPASVTEPLTFVRLDGLGAVVRDRR
ncbi:MAG: DUF4920 domain-containing protein [Planctomycetota bacterium]|jgi:hypothetical protein